MKMKVELSHLVKRKLHNLKKELVDEYGEKKAKDILIAIMDRIDMLGDNPKVGTELSGLYDIDVDYWYLYAKHNYFFYRIDSKRVIIFQMFNEREDFMMKLFGLSGRSQESIDYWGE